MFEGTGKRGKPIVNAELLALFYKTKEQFVQLDAMLPDGMERPRKNGGG